MAYGFGVEPSWLSVTRQDVLMSNLPPALDGLRVAFLADIHYRPDDDAALLDAVVATVRAENPDIVALGGDYILGKDPAGLEPMLKKLSGLTAKHGVYAVIGNHDGWTLPGDTIAKAFARHGIECLINQHTILNLKGEAFAVAGTDFVWGGHPDLGRTFRGLRQRVPTLALVHEPDYFDHVVQARDSVLQLSGHSHGGQCRVPVIGYRPRAVRWGSKYVYGPFTQRKAGLWVTRGLGTTGIRVRFACRPELALLTLRPR